jgi:NAD(P)-dependent dehydrogenase (short-subunit alcohol dehydrogenase family)
MSTKVIAGDLAGKSVVVTGASGGIGRAVCVGFAEIGATVVAVDIPNSAVKDTVNALPGHGHVALELDINDLTAHDGIFELAQSIAPFAALTNCAAYLKRRDTVDDVTELDWDQQIDTNLKAAFYLNRSAYNSFKKNKQPGSIVNFSSQGWWSGGFGGSVVYAASKGGVVTMTRGLARSFAPFNVRVNAIAPGGVNTAMMQNQTPEALASFVSMIPLGRLAEPEEMVDAVLFLSSQSASYITGATLNISGGQLMY